MAETLPLPGNLEPNKPRFFLYWIGLNVVAWVAWILFATIPNAMNNSDLLSFVAFSAFGVGMGVLQWLLLRQHFSIAWKEWVPLTAVGVMLGFFGLMWTALQDNYIIFSPPGTPVLEWDPLVGGALLGLAIGCCQIIAWRPRLGRVLVWVAVNIFGWSLGMFLPQYVAYLMQSANTPLLSSIFPVIFAATVTGIALTWFLRGQPDLDS